jgi:hypothetical protein
MNTGTTIYEQVATQAPEPATISVRHTNHQLRKRGHHETTHIPQNGCRGGRRPATSDRLPQLLVRRGASHQRIHRRKRDRLAKPHRSHRPVQRIRTCQPASVISTACNLRSSELNEVGQLSAASGRGQVAEVSLRRRQRSLRYVVRQSFRLDCESTWLIG